MENSNKIVPPHLNAEVYRTDTTGTSTMFYLDYLRIHEDGSTLIGCSELTGRYWNGAADVFKSVNEAGQRQKSEKRAINLQSGTSDGCFVNSSKKILLCEDSGAVSIWCTSDEDQHNAWHQWTEEVSAAEHDNAALAVDCLSPDAEYVTVGADGHGKVWDIERMICIRNYSAAHSKPIYGVSVRPNSNTDFATCSMDQYVSLWDQNVDKPVLDLYQNNCGVRCLQWIDVNKIIFGDEAGILSIVDVRSLETTLNITEFPAAIHKIAIHPECNKVAVCCDNKTVTVCDISEDTKVKTTYQKSQAHNNFVRGVAWDVKDDKILHSLGWDGEIKSHTVMC
ncbi:methylosome protein 50 isoform X2 [Manduca sexta]|nr:methylosome protein 50 isoform X2 [Manduca sexta]XP_030024305.1 methylosome protein 50 isoform X2 [Manduca sexta]XP_030024306.1 methylosome protein 50 isoform X2 [Manduca sexta]KAG6449555.1 hypothetical protein O3G_MSEX006092 [Manduca sexta]KAG6449556.1 hypothetical protein O3G_MSEX006092 [Manduca sexta]KAG6449557.1 hypothetical protein O3G_MSEX006092 [Manduca sexta]KAG6449558.1 hypothetical protein O3G_MSEX006092 [Manduca sexta]